MALPVFEGFANILREQEERILQETAAVRALQESIQVNYAAVKLRIAQQQAGPPETRDRAVQVDAPEPSPDGLRPSAPPCCPCCSAHDVDGGGHSAHPRGPAPAPVEPPPPPIPTAGPAPQHTGAIAAVGDLLLTAVQRGFDVQVCSAAGLVGSAGTSPGAGGGGGAPTSTTPVCQPLREGGNDARRSTGRSGRQNAATRRNMRREERVTVQGPVKKQQPHGMSHSGAALKLGVVVRLWPVYLCFNFLGGAPKSRLIGHCVCVFDNQKSSIGFVPNICG